MTLTIIYILILIQLLEGNNISTQLYLSVFLPFFSTWVDISLPSAWDESCWECHMDSPHPGSPAGPWGWKVLVLCFTTELHTQMEKKPQLENSPGQSLARFEWLNPTARAFSRWMFPW